MVERYEIVFVIGECFKWKMADNDKHLAQPVSKLCFDEFSLYLTIVVVN